MKTFRLALAFAISLSTSAAAFGQFGGGGFAGGGMGGGFGGMGGGGVMLDAEGMLKATKTARPRSKEPKLHAEMARNALERRISLRMLEAELKKAGDAKSLPDGLAQLAGLCRIDAVIVDRSAKDVLLVGPAGAGKSTFAAQRFASTQIISSDELRARVADDPTDQSATADAFRLLLRPACQ